MRLSGDYMKKAIDFLINNIDGDVVIACSGGPDSMALFDILLKVRDVKKNNIICAHVNHKVRCESDLEEVMVRDFCKKNNVIFELYTIKDYSGSNFESEAREKRYSFFESVLKKYSAHILLTAHHGDDLMETILYRIVRGSNLEGYSGFKYISNRSDYIILRPLIWYSKDVIMEYVKFNNIPYAIDYTNNDINYTRNRFRHLVLPVYKNINKDAHLKFLQFSNLLNKYDSFVNNYVDKVYNNVVNSDLCISLLLKEDDLIIDNVIYKFLFSFNSNINSRHIDLVKKVILSDKKNCLINLPGFILEKKYDKLGLYSGSYSFNYEINDYVNLNNGYVIKRVDEWFNDSNFVCKLSLNEIKLPLYVRNYKKGDRIDIKNGYNKRVSDIFIDSKISNRSSYPVVVDNLGNIIWLPGIKKSKFCKTKNEKYDIILVYCLEEKYEK